MPDVAFPTIDFNKAITDFNNAVKDGAYVAVGLGVLGFQKAQVQRVELTKQLESQIGELGSLPSTLSARLEPYAKAAWEQLDEVRTQLTKQVGAAGQAFETQVEAARDQFGELAKAVDEAVQPARKQIDEQVARFEQQLPAGARSVLQTVREAATTQEHAFRAVIGLD